MNEKLKILFLVRPGLYEQFGGDTIQVEYTAKYLRNKGMEIIIHHADNKYTEDFDILHFFNLSRPAQLLPYLNLNKPLFISSIYIDYSEYDHKFRPSLRFLSSIFGKHSIEYFKNLARYLKSNGSFPGWQYLLNGQKKSINKILEKCDILIAASNYELEHIKRDFGILPSQTAVINLGIEHMPDINGNYRRNGLICIARIEGLKNQLNLIRSIKHSDYKLKIVGKAAINHKGYYEQCREEAGENVEFYGHLKSAEVAEELQKSKVHILPGYFETTGLASLEALYNGCSIVVSDRGAQREIFGNHAFYCEPDDIQSIKKAIDEAYQNQSNNRDWVQQNFSWEKAAIAIHALYLKNLKA